MIMKRMLLTFSALMLGAGATMADGTDYLTFRQADGSEISVPSAGLKITFNNGQLVAQSAGQADLTLPVAALQAMFFSATPTSIATPLVMPTAPLTSRVITPRSQSQALANSESTSWRTSS